MSWNPEQVYVTTHALQRFRERAHGRPDEANHQTVQKSVRAARKIRSTDVVLRPRGGQAECTKGFTLYVNDSHGICFVLEVLDVGFRVVTCLAANRDVTGNPELPPMRASEKYFGEQFAEWWHRNRKTPTNESAAMLLAGMAWNAARASVRSETADV